MASRRIMIAAGVLAMTGFVGSASASVGPAAAAAGPTQITPPKASNLVTPNILPRLLVTSLPTR